MSYLLVPGSLGPSFSLARLSYPPLSSPTLLRCRAFAWNSDKTDRRPRLVLFVWLSLCGRRSVRVASLRGVLQGLRLALSLQSPSIRCPSNLISSAEEDSKTTWGRRKHLDLAMQGSREGAVSSVGKGVVRSMS